MDQSIRKHFATGDYLTRYPEGSAFDLRIDCMQEKRGWIERKPGSVSRPVFPGSAILFEDSYYEVFEIGRESALPGRVCYYLRRWEDHFALRTQFVYSIEECNRAVQQQKRDSKDRFASIFIQCILPLAGLIPAEDQRRIEKEYGIPGTRMTFWGTLLILFPSGFGTVMSMASSFGATFPGPSFLRALILVSPYFLMESFVRLYSCLKLDEPIGSALVVLPMETVRMIRNNSGANKTKRSERVKVKDSSLLYTNDEIRRQSTPEYDLEITSALPKPHWTQNAAIGFEGAWYNCVSAETKNRRYVFHLKKMDDPILLRTAYEYTPAEVQTLYRDHLKKERGVWIEPLSPLWGFLEKEDQEKLAAIYDYQPLKFTKWSIIATALLCITNLLVTGLNIAAGIPHTIDFVLLIPCVYFTIESVRRWKQYRAGNASGSLLGKPLGFLVRRAF